MCRSRQSRSVSSASISRFTPSSACRNTHSRAASALRYGGAVDLGDEHGDDQLVERDGLVELGEAVLRRQRGRAENYEHSHPDMVIIPLTTSGRRLILGDRSDEVEKRCHEAGWVDAQTYIGENIGTSPSHALFVELHVELSLDPPPNC